MSLLAHTQNPAHAERTGSATFVAAVALPKAGHLNLLQLYKG